MINPGLLIALTQLRKKDDTDKGNVTINIYTGGNKDAVQIEKIPEKEKEKEKIK